MKDFQKSKKAQKLAVFNSTVIQAKYNEIKLQSQTQNTHLTNSQLAIYFQKN